MDVLRSNISVCIGRKDKKVALRRSKYPTWWLVLVDFMMGGQGNSGQPIAIPHPQWNRVIVIHPQNYAWAYDV